jgi:hypothetical protein
MNGNDLSNVKHKASKHFRKKREYLEDKICELETNIRKVVQICVEA